MIVHWTSVSSWVSPDCHKFSKRLSSYASHNNKSPCPICLIGSQFVQSSLSPLCSIISLHGLSEWPGMCCISGKTVGNISFFFIRVVQVIIDQLCWAKLPPLSRPLADSLRQACTNANRTLHRLRCRRWSLRSIWELSRCCNWGVGF